MYTWPRWLYSVVVLVIPPLNARAFVETVRPRPSAYVQLFAPSGDTTTATVFDQLGPSGARRSSKVVLKFTAPHRSTNAVFRPKSSYSAHVWIPFASVCCFTVPKRWSYTEYSRCPNAFSVMTGNRPES